jgi:hypothetical protein
VPRASLSAQGSEWLNGRPQVGQAQPETGSGYDINHKVAAVRKRALGGERAGHEFSRWAGPTTQRVQHPARAARAPPRHRRKARYLSAGAVVAWGVRLLQSWAEAGSQRQEWNRQRVEEAGGWGRQYRHAVEQWRPWVEVGTLPDQVVKAPGWSAGGAQQWQPRLATAGTRPRTQPLGAEFVQVVTEAGATAKVGERLVGRSEVIESSFGKGTRRDGEHARRGLTGWVVALGAIVAPTTADGITPAVPTVPTKTVLTWGREQLGKTVQATRRARFAPARKAEQKQEQIPLAA